MKKYKPEKSMASINILAILIFGDVLMGIITKYIDSYILLYLFRIFMLVFTLYCLYYVLLAKSLIYEVDNDNIKISGLFGFKNIIIPIKSIEGYHKEEGIIKGVKISGVGSNKFAFGKSVIDKIGIANMYITSSSKAIYLKTEGTSYGISPELSSEFEKRLIEKGITMKEFTTKINKSVDIYKDKSFFIPFIIVSLLIFILTINPFILYLTRKLPAQMPLSFDALFRPIDFGTGKQFAFRQMTYGVLNMIILVCMYYASYFYAKYDRKSAYKYIYIPLVIAVTFLFIQIRIIISFI